MKTIKDNLKAAVIAWAKRQHDPAFAKELAAMPTNVFDEALTPVAEKCKAVVEDCEMALSGEWDKSDEGFEDTKNSMEDLLNILDVQVSIEKTEDNYEEYLNDHYADNYTHQQLFEKFEYLTSTERELPMPEATLQLSITNSLMGTALKRFAPIEFQTGYNDWNP